MKDPIAQDLEQGAMGILNNVRPTLQALHAGAGMTNAVCAIANAIPLTLKALAEANLVAVPKASG
ncbi:hypothetical protein ACYOEI_12180 [Singulisphaera rosea]